MPPDKKEGGPGTTRNPPNHESSASTNATNTPTVARRGGKRRYPRAFVSLYEPTARRTCWWGAYICPHCKMGHFARLRGEADASGVRRSGCGRMVALVVARTYRRKRAA